MDKPKYLVNKNLEDWFSAQPKNRLPDQRNFLKRRYEDLKQEIKPYLDEVVTGALVADVQRILKDKDYEMDRLIYLTGHGTEHVATVISKATDILQATKTKISVYEGYLLLCAIQFHDVGNIFGRKQHEKMISIVMDAIWPQGGTNTDAPENNMIKRIAKAHGGINLEESSKDTIKKLNKKDPLFHQKVRPRLLASILRLADELADDSSRASPLAHLLPNFPGNSELFHSYAEALHTVHISSEEITLAFEYSDETALRTYAKVTIDNGTETTVEAYLLDEIYLRTLKTYFEKEYCIGYCGKYINAFDRINVSIKIYPKKDNLQDPREINYSFEDKGYPETTKDIFAFCPTLEGITGKSIADEIRAAMTLNQHPGIGVSSNGN